MIVVDTSVWIGYFRGTELPQVQALRHLPAEEILLGDIVLLEILQGERSESHANRLARELQAFTGARMLGAEVAQAAARNYRHLRGLGITIRSMADTVIATYCIHRGYPLLHNDRDYAAFEAHLGLEVYQPHF